jgi:hypothetical protein
MTGSRAVTIQEVAADPSFWLVSAHKLYEAAYFLWESRNDHDRNPRSSPRTTVLHHRLLRASLVTKPRR